MTTRVAPTEGEVREYLSTLSNWGRWGDGAAGLRGTLELITPARIAAAGRTIERGVAISCALPFVYAGASEGVDGEGHLVPGASAFPLHYMIDVESIAGAEPDRRVPTFDGFLIQPHGQLLTHIDAPCHTVLNGTLYNGVPAAEAFSDTEARLGDMDLVADGVVGRGVLLDVPAAQGRRWLDDTEAIFPADLERAEEAHGVRVGSGDCLLVRTGYRGRNPFGMRTGPGYARPGLQAACLPWLFEREVALLASDVPTDCFPHGYDDLGLPVHTVGMWAMGLWLIDNCRLEALAAQCVAAGRHEFFLSVAPLTLTGGTGSPVNPLAIF